MTQSALIAGYSEHTANKAGERLEGRHQALIKEILPSVGASNLHVALALSQALGAKKVIYCDGDMQETEIADHKIRMDAAKLIAQVTGQLDTKATVALQIVLPNVAQDEKAWGDALIIAQPEEQ